MKIPVFVRKNAALITIVLVAAAVSASSLVNGFNIDDGPLLLENKAVHGVSLENIKAVLSSVPNGLEFLPVRDLTYMLDHQVWGLDPFGYHLSNLIWYAACCAILYLFLVRLLAPWTDQSASIAFIAALLFTVHPVHVESMAGIAQRKDLVSGFLFFWSLLMYLRFRESGARRQYAFSLVLFFLALLAKGTVLVLPLVIVLIDYLDSRTRPSLKRVFLSALPFFLISAAATLAQSALLQQGGVINQNYLGFGHGYEKRIFSSFRAVMYYLRLLVFPSPLTILHTFRFSQRLLELPVLLSIAGTGIILVSAFRWRKTTPALSFALSWFLVLLLPVIGLIPIATVIAERYLFLPSAAFCLAAAVMVRRGAGSILGKFSYCVLVLVVVAFMAVSVNRAGDWKDALTLYEAGIKTNPESPRLRWLAGREHFTSRRYPEAFERFGEARLLDPQYAIDYVVYTALLELEHRDPDKALAELRLITVPQKEDVLEVNVVTGRALLMQGNQEGRRYLEAAMKSRIRLGIIPRGEVAAELR
jgi:protein O-mannosyl-transferase